MLPNYLTFNKINAKLHISKQNTKQLGIYYSGTVGEDHCLPCTWFQLHQHRGSQCVDSTHVHWQHPEANPLGEPRWAASPLGAGQHWDFSYKMHTI